MVDSETTYVDAISSFFYAGRKIKTDNLRSMVK